MKVIIQAQLGGVFETIWSGTIIRPDGSFRTNKSNEVQRVAILVSQDSANRQYQVGVSEGREVALVIVTGNQLLAEVRRALEFVTVRMLI